MEDEITAKNCACYCHSKTCNNNLTCIYPRTGEILYCRRKHRKDGECKVHSKKKPKQRPSIHAKEEKKTPLEVIYIPRVMADMMVATTANSTSIHFGFGHMCEEHK